MRVFTGNDKFREYILDPDVNRKLIQGNIVIEKVLDKKVPWLDCIQKRCDFAAWAGAYLDTPMRKVFRRLRDEPMSWSMLIRYNHEFLDRELKDILIENVMGNFFAVTRLCPTASKMALIFRSIRSKRWKLTLLQIPLLLSFL